MKVAPVIRECERRGVPVRFVHTGQHYDYSMSDDFIMALGIPQPDINLEVGSGTQGYQCAEVIKLLEADLAMETPDAVIVVGDVNSTLGAAIAASKMFIPLAHVEAGLRSFNRGMPEELNRIATDALADFLFTTEESGNRNLAREGRGVDSIFLVGNTMIDSLVLVMDKVKASDVVSRLGLASGEYCFVTLHRPSNVDEPGRLRDILVMLRGVSESLKVVFAIHPRTLKNIKSARCEDVIACDKIKSIDPVGYIDSLALMSSARLVITDSGGIQGETTFLGVPCLTLRHETELLVTVEFGTNLIVTEDCALLLQTAVDVIDGGGRQGRIPHQWDGHASERILDILGERL
ncbi:MAG: UDP-N-acetylglucosamine 2-epimerase (non-hydrolyzing) [Candidatus Anoxymicrobium japonicum]|uniref:UDP-N-acetylglucosamine 2-epimerase (Non-hydrolyzing) n=1 Tax=Candidatus Anoxymicrobium japonicum TaxID=2013648 RepID=A0A2N3G8D1_9ACTN|nr:MAG: UDP-N-acetylglucosamine 2-epimerase (non-hydrolyzing) [Candidatus Anoxymicrobium japonicum]